MPESFDKFTERARKVLQLAQEEAGRLNHNYIGTEHLLLGLVREGEGVAAKVLANLGVELNKVRSAVESIIGRGDRAVIGDIGLTPRAKKVIELSVDEARRLNHRYIGTEHILLGLVREREGIAAGVLESLGVSLDKVRSQVIYILTQSESPSQQSSATDVIPARKAEHVELAARMDGGPGASWGDIVLLHQSLPELDMDDVDLRTPFLGKTLRYPVVIASMTGGHPDTAGINATLARAAQAFGIAMGVGSQRAAVRDRGLLSTYTVARDMAPDAFLMANVGVPQLVAQGDQAPLTSQEVQELVDTLRADALAVHLNYLQEAVQPEGDTRARGCLGVLTRLAEAISVPLIAKETGAGISGDQGRLLVKAGVRAIDVGGAGGTSFARIEAVRAERQGRVREAELGQVLTEWGIPTAVAVVETASLPVPIIATGGVRTGLDAAKALALGATLVGVGRPALVAALEGDEALERWLADFLHQLRVALFLAGAQNPTELRGKKRIILGDTLAWLRQLGHMP